MTVPMLPSELRCLLRSNYSHTLGDDRRVTDAEEGPMRMRRQRSLSADTVQMYVDVDLNGREVFNRFYKETLFNGSLPFHMPDPILHGVAIKDNYGNPLLAADGSQLLISAYWLCIFTKSAPVHTLNNVRWNISFSVMVMPS